MKRKGLLLEVIEGRIEEKMLEGKKRMKMFMELYKKESYGIMKRRANIGYFVNVRSRERK